VSAGSHPPQLDELRQRLRRRLPELRSEYGVLSLGLFGSRVRGDALDHSDLDVLVEFGDRPLSLLQFLALEHRLTDLLGVKVDLVEKDGLKPAIGRRILQEVVPL